MLNNNLIKRKRGKIMGRLTTVRQHTRECASGKLTTVRRHNRKIDDLSQYDPLSEEWVEKMNEKSKALIQSTDTSKVLEKNIKEMESANKKEEAGLSSKLEDSIDDSEAVLGKMSDKIDNRSVEKFKDNTKLQDEKGETHHLQSEINAAKKVAKKKVKKQAKESKKAIKKT
jgi:hypothetical protein